MKQEIKYFEVRDKNLLIPISAYVLSSDSQEVDFLLRRAGFSEEKNYKYVLVTKLTNFESHYFHTLWDNSAMRVAHNI